MYSFRFHQPHVPSGAVSLYHVFLQLTGGSALSPKSWQGKVLMVSWAWFVLLCIAAYTANLASFFVSMSSLSTPQSLSEAMERNMQICIWPKSPSGEWFRNNNPTFDAIEVLDSESIIPLNSGACSGAVLNSFAWAAHRNNQKTNADCGVAMRGTGA